MSQLITLSNEITALGPQFEAVLADKSISFESEKAFAIQALQANEYLAKVAFANKPSLHNAVTNVAAIGISLNPIKKQAYLVPRRISGNPAVCLDISYMGLMHLAQQTGAIQWGQAHIVRKNDKFILGQIGQPPIHKRDVFAKDDDRGEIVGAYVVVKTGGGDYLTHCMNIADIYKSRDRSEAYKSGKSSPWKTDEGEMIKKTVVKQASKYWPHRERLQQAIYHLDTEGGEGFEKDITPTTAQDFAEQAKFLGEKTDEAMALVKKLESIANTGDLEALRNEFAAIGKEGRMAVGADEWARIKAICEEGNHAGN